MLSAVLFKMFRVNWLRCALLSSLTLTLRRTSHCSTNHAEADLESSATDATLVSDEDNMVLFRCSAGPAVYQAFIGFNPLSNSTSASELVLALAELGA